MKTLKILLVEDDPVLGTALSVGLKLEKYEVEWAKSCANALDKFSPGIYDLVSLDIGLPDGSGMDVCKEIRKQDQNVPVIFLTAKTDEETLLKGLEIGGNDFVKKPFSQKELFARIRVLLRKNPWQNEVSLGGLTIYPDRREIHFKGTALDLNRRQFDILAFFLSHPDQIITREQLLGHLGQDGAVYDRTVDSHLSQTRKVLKAANVDSIHLSPVYGVGYRLELLE
jgi:DNA-binding response OmpR family regulator